MGYVDAMASEQVEDDAGDETAVERGGEPPVAGARRRRGGARVCRPAREPARRPPPRHPRRRARPARVRCSSPTRGGWSGRRGGRAACPSPWPASSSPTNLVALGMLVRDPHLVEAGRHAAAAGRHAGVADQRHRLRPALLGARPRRTGRAPHRSPGTGCRRPTGGSRRTRTRTPSSRSRPPRARASNWRPEFVDYLYVSLTNSSAFSPTDTMPLTARAKMLMGLEATAALLTVAARRGACHRCPGAVSGRTAYISKRLGSHNGRLLYLAGRASAHWMACRPTTTSPARSARAMT